MWWVGTEGKHRRTQTKVRWTLKLNCDEESPLGIKWRETDEGNRRGGFRPRQLHELKPKGTDEAIKLPWRFLFSFPWKSLWFPPLPLNFSCQQILPKFCILHNKLYHFMYSGFSATQANFLIYFKLFHIHTYRHSLVTSG